MNQVYFSHSYRDVPINTYFSVLFKEAGITLRADQKTEVWCVAKLERYMFEMDGFVSIIPQRLAANDSLEYSPYIAYELNLARRARTARLLFVDDQILNLYKEAFPSNAIPFFRDAPQTERSLHIEAVSRFRKNLATGGARPRREYVARQVTVIAGQGSVMRDAASLVAALLRSHGYKPSVVSAPARLEETFNDITTFESMISSELCAFVLGKDLSCMDLLLAMAHAQCIPSMRLRQDSDAVSQEPELSGVVRWKTAADLMSSFEALLLNYQSVFATADKDRMQQLSTPEQISAALNLWDPRDGPGLVVHVIPDDSYVTDRVDGVVRSLTASEPGRVQSDSVCRELYDRIKRDRLYYTYEPVLTQSNVQRIRRPREIDALNCGTCIDFACLFASLLEAAHERPVVIVVGTEGGTHALGAYVTPDAIVDGEKMSLGDLRGAILRGEIVPFETTGAVEAKRGTVGAETDAERAEGDRMLDYRTAKNAGIRLLLRNDIELKHFIDVPQARRSRSFDNPGL